MTYVMLVGTDAALLEGLAQSLAKQGRRPVVRSSLPEARDFAVINPPIVLIAERALASEGGADLLSIPVAGGGARILFRPAATQPCALLPAIQRAVLADITLPLERQRLSALVQSVSDRAIATGRLTPLSMDVVSPSPERGD